MPILLEEHGGRLYGLSLKLCGLAEDAKDLVSLVDDVFARWHEQAA